MDPTGPEVAVLAFVAQHLHSFKGMNDALIDVVLLATAFGLYWCQHPAVAPIGPWILAGLGAGLAGVGFASALGHIGVAPRTNTREGTPGGVPPAAAALLMVIILVAALPAHAAKITDPDRWNATLGVDFESHSADPAPLLQKEFTANAHLRADVTEHLAAGADGAFGFGNRVARVTPDVRYRLAPGSGLSVGIGIDFLAGNAERVPAMAVDFRAEALGSIPLWKKVTVGVGASYGFQSKELRLAVGPRLWLKQAVVKP